MNAGINQILHHFFQKRTLEEVNVADIEQMVSEYPYFVPAQYLLTKKYLETNNETYQKQVSKTAVFFNNPHWLDLMLHDDALVAANALQANEDAVVPGEVETVTIAHNDNTETPQEVLTADKIIQTGTEDEVVTIADEPVEEISGVVFMEEVKESVINDVEPITTQQEEIETAEEISGAVFMEEIKEDLNSDVEVIAPEQEYGEDPEVTEPFTGANIPKLKSILDREPPPQTAGTSIIPIEPLYTIDYFASQGIKADAGAESKDKLSVKLRSFTDWLKTMKRIHPEKFEAGMDAGAQTAIQNIAEHSNESKETVTETMAEVFARQGLNKKAAEVYHKLSLLNPDKRVYFAAKIAQLKEM